MAEEQTINLEGKPYYIKETDNGIFYAVSTLELKRDEGYCGWECSVDETIGKLELGLDIVEVPTRDISIVVRSPKNELKILYVIEELKKLASVSGYDYFSHEKFGQTIARLIMYEGNAAVNEVKPRLFRKLVND